MLAGTIPIASKAGGVPEMVNGSSAVEYLFTPGDINEFMDRIEMLASQPRNHIVDIGMRLKEHAIRLVNKEKIGSKLTDLFESLS
jgi:glycosyltransferase involved in cell wall biosynthesis